MAESIAMLKKNFENIEKVLKNEEKKLEMNYLQVQNQFSEIMQDTNMKINQMLKNIAYLTQVTEKGKSSLETRQGEPVIVEAIDAGRVHIQELYHDQARNIGVHIEEVDIPGSSNEEDGQRRAIWTQHAPYFDSREQRRPWNAGHQDPVFCEERHDQRIPNFNMQRVHHAAHQ
jgi:hypothetical protein